MAEDLGCAFHEVCPMTPDTYLVCFECQHAFTAQELLTLTNEVVRQTAFEGRIRGITTSTPPVWNDGFGEPKYNVGSYIPYVDPEDIRVCPLCTHDL